MTQRSHPARALLAADSLAAGNGGICRVARLMATALADFRDRGTIRAEAITLSDSRPAADIPLDQRLMNGSRLRMTAATHLAALRPAHFLYDFAGLARAHCMFPPVRRPFLTYIHGIEVWEGARENRVNRARRADMLLSNSAYTRDRADRIFGGLSRAKVCWLGTETDALPEVAPDASGPPAVVILGRMDENSYKGHAELIDCWPRVISSVPGAILRIVGRGPGEAFYRDRAAKSPAAGAIEFTGFVPDAQMPQVWSAATVLAMPSRGEGFGLVYIEAMRHAVPVIASIHDAAPEVNVDGVTGYNVDMDRPDELPERLIHLLKNRDLAASLGRGGQARWQDQFSYSAFRRRFDPLLLEFLRA